MYSQMNDINNVPLNKSPQQQSPSPSQVQQSPLPEIKTQLPLPSKKSPSLLLVLSFLLLLFVSIFLYLLFFTNVLDSLNLVNKKDQQPQQQQEEQEDDSNPEESEEEQEVEDEQETLTPFEGDTFSAQLPQDWIIEEYYNGEGTDMLTGGISYTGLTGLKIFKDDTEVFFMQAVYGIGFAGCPNYAKFTDESITYYNQILEDNEVSGTELNIQDYTAIQYNEFVWLGKTFRRVEREYSYDTIEGNQYFEPPCVPTLVDFDDLEFLPEEGPSAKTYDYSPTDEATLQDLDVIDTILESMEILD